MAAQTERPPDRVVRWPHQAARARDAAERAAAR